MIAEIILLGFALLLSLFAFFLSFSFIFGPPYLPTPMHAIKEMLILAKVGRRDIVFDLGSGDGIVLIEAARMGATAKGFEINPFLVLITKVRAHIKGLSNQISVYAKPYQKADLSNATVIFCYNMPKFMPALNKKINREAKKSAKIISYKFPIKNLRLISKTKSGIYLYSPKKSA